MITAKKFDYIIAAIAGFFTALFLLPVLKNLGVAISYKNTIVLTAVPIIWMVVILIGSIIQRIVSFAYQFAKFGITGFLNVAIDFGILNIFIFMTGITAGYLYALFKAISFLFANTNSYFWNKFWTFRKQVQNIAAPAKNNGLQADALHKRIIAKEYIQFLIVSVIGLGVNVGTASLVVNLVGVQFGVSPEAWANVGAVFGSATGLIWNFIGYKLIVFKT